MNGKPTRRMLTSQFLFGAVVVLVGLLLLVESTGLVSTDDVLVYVPLLFVGLGVWALFQSDLRNIVGPVLLVLVAGAWQLVAFEIATVEEVVAFWPVLVIAFGLSVILGQVRSRARPTDAAFTNAFAAFGGVEKRNTSKAFEGADLTAMFGGIELDVRDVSLEQRPARVNAVAAFGGVDVAVPRDWNVQLDVLPILGGASDDRPRREHASDEIDLVVTGFAVFGGVTVSD